MTTTSRSSPERCAASSWAEQQRLQRVLRSRASYYCGHIYMSLDTLYMYRRIQTCIYVSMSRTILPCHVRRLETAKVRFLEVVISFYDKLVLSSWLCRHLAGMTQMGQLLQLRGVGLEQGTAATASPALRLLLLLLLLRRLHLCKMLTQPPLLMAAGAQGAPVSDDIRPPPPPLPPPQLSLNAYCAR